MKTTLQLLLSVALLGISSVASARTISWGSAVGDSLLDSTGSALDGSFTFQLGTFGSGFIPTEFNIPDWYSNWKVFDQSELGVTWDPTPPDTFLSSEATLKTNFTSDSPFATPTTFATGEKAYIWVFDSQTNSPSSEWALISGTSTGPASDTAWFMPTPSTDQTLFPLNWRFDTASSVIYGGLNNVQGPGEHIFSPGSFVLQTHAAPEPGSALLAIIAGLFHLRRRR